MALILDGLSASSAGVASHLHLLEHAWRQLLLDDANAVSAAYVAAVYVAVRAARAFTTLTNVLSLPLEFGRGPVIEIAKRDGDLDLNVVAARLPG